MTHHPFYTLTFCALLLSACGDVETSGSNATDQSNYNDFVDASNDAADVLDQIDGDVLAEAPEDNTLELNGIFAISADGALGDDTVLSGEMDMDVDFSEETVSGSIYNAFLVEDLSDADSDDTLQSSVVELDGSIALDGQLDLDASGGFYDSSNSQTWQIEADGSGTFTDSETDATSETTYRLDIDINGDFYDTSDIGTVDGVGDIGDVASLGIIEGNVDVTSGADTTLYDITGESVYVVYELLEDE